VLLVSTTKPKEKKRGTIRKRNTERRQIRWRTFKSKFKRGPLKSDIKRGP
jgi:hypothetical protein